MNNKATLILAMLIGLTALMSLAEGSAPLPDDDNPRGYLHCENDEDDAGRLWLNSVHNDSESAPHNHKSGTGTVTTTEGYGFPYREGPDNTSSLDHALYFRESNAMVTGQVHIEFDTNEPDNLTFSLTDNGQDIGSQLMDYETDGTYQFSIELPDNTTVQEGHELLFHVNWEQSWGQYEWTIYLDDTTYIDFPIATDTDDDGEPDHMDEDDDNDGYTDEEEAAEGTDPLDPEDHPIEEQQNGGDGEDEDDDEEWYEDTMVLGSVGGGVALVGIFCFFMFVIRPRRRAADEEDEEEEEFEDEEEYGDEEDDEEEMEYEDDD